MNLKWTKFNLTLTVLTNSNYKLFLGLELTSYIQEADDSNRTDSPA